MDISMKNIVRDWGGGYTTQLTAIPEFPGCHTQISGILH